MEKQEPTREELISEIADIVGKVKPIPSLGSQVLSGTISLLSRTGFFAYSAYLAMLFHYRFAKELTKASSTNWSALDILLLIGAVGFMAYLIFRKVSKDRLFPAREFFYPILRRTAKIILVAVFYMWLFGASPLLASSEFLVLIASFFILNSGYDFDLTEPRRPKNRLDA